MLPRGDIRDGDTGLGLGADHTLQGARGAAVPPHPAWNRWQIPGRGRISTRTQYMSFDDARPSGGVLADPQTLFRPGGTGSPAGHEQQLVLEWSRSRNPTRMVQIAMAIKDVAFQDIVCSCSTDGLRRWWRPRHAGHLGRRRPFRRARQQQADQIDRRCQPGLRRPGRGHGNQAGHWRLRLHPGGHRRRRRACRDRRACRPCRRHGRSASSISGTTAAPAPCTVAER